MKTRGRALCGVTLALVVVLGGAHAMADDAPQVETLIREGLDLRRDGRDARALPLFQKAYELDRTPRTAGQLGLCELAVGYWLDAERHLIEGLASPQHPWIAKNLSSLEKSLSTARENIGELAIAGEPAGAQLSIDGHNAGRIPLPQSIRVEKGPHDVALQAADYAPAKRAIVVGGGQKQTLTIVLEKMDAAPAVAVTPPLVSIPAPAPGEPGAGGRRTLAWVAGGAAVVAIAIGAVEGINWIHKRNQFDDHVDLSNPAVKNCGSDDPSYGGAGCQKLHDELVTARTFAIVGFAAGGALAIGSAILFATSHPTAPTSTALSCTPDLQGKGLSCRISF